jgi:hypothetical protein
MNAKKIDDRVLERYLLNELPGDRMKEITKILESDALLKERLDALKESNRSILRDYPAETVAPRILDRVRTETARAEYADSKKERPLWQKRLFFASPALAAALVLIFLVSPFKIDHPGIDPKPPVQDGTRIKGTPGAALDLLVFRETGGKIEQLEAGMNAKAGDRLQLAYTAPKDTYGVILSIDGNGVVTLHFPDKAGQSTKLENGNKINLKNSYELDDAPGFERFFFLTSSRPLDVKKAMQAARNLARRPGHAKTGTIEPASPTPGQRVNQVSILINKGADQ